MPTHTATYLYEPDSFIPLAQLTAGFDHTALAATGTDRQPLRCYQAQTATLYYFQTDHLGTPQDITDTEGRIVWSGQYRAWGQLAQAHNGQGEKAHIHNPFRFQGQYHDRETGLHYNRFRYYDPRIGRFTTQDPIGLMGGDNLYQYAPNPTGWIDPLGLTPCECKKDDRRRRYHSSSATYTKHTKAKTREEAISLSRNRGAAQYWDESTSGRTTSKDMTSFRNSIEKEALSSGTHLPRSGGSDYYIFDAGRNIGFNNGKPTQYMRAKVTKSTNEFHGHPISSADYNIYLRGSP